MKRALLLAGLALGTAAGCSSKDAEPSVIKGVPKERPAPPPQGKGKAKPAP